MDGGWLVEWSGVNFFQRKMRQQDEGGRSGENEEKTTRLRLRLRNESVLKDGGGEEL